MKKLITVLATLGLYLACLVGVPSASADYGPPPASCGDVKLGNPAGLFYWQSLGNALNNYCYGISYPGMYANSYGDATGYGSVVSTANTDNGYSFTSQSWYPPADINNPQSVADSVAAGEHNYILTTPNGTYTSNGSTVTGPGIPTNLSTAPALPAFPGVPSIADVTEAAQTYVNTQLSALPGLPTLPGTP
jgi:hypothetical protein